MSSPFMYDTCCVSASLPPPYLSSSSSTYNNNRKCKELPLAGEVLFGIEASELVSSRDRQAVRVHVYTEDVKITVLSERIR